MQQVKKYILEQVAGQNLSQKDAKNLLLEIHNSDNKQNSDVAVIGIACNFADTDSPEAYWNHLENGESCMVEYPEERRKYFSPLSDNAHYAEFLGQKLMSEEEKKNHRVLKLAISRILKCSMRDSSIFLHAKHVLWTLHSDCSCKLHGVLLKTEGMAEIVLSVPILVSM